MENATNKISQIIKESTFEFFDSKIEKLKKEKHDIYEEFKKHLQSKNYHQSNNDTADFIEIIIGLFITEKVLNNYKELFGKLIIDEDIISISEILEEINPGLQRILQEYKIEGK